jgi:hypothetical protein
VKNAIDGSNIPLPSTSLAFLATVVFTNLLNGPDPDASNIPLPSIGPTLPMCSHDPKPSISHSNMHVPPLVISHINHSLRHTLIALYRLTMPF